MKVKNGTRQEKVRDFHSGLGAPGANRSPSACKLQSPGLSARYFATCSIVLTITSGIVRPVPWETGNASVASCVSHVGLCLCWAECDAAARGWLAKPGDLQIMDISPLVLRDQAQLREGLDHDALRFMLGDNGDHRSGGLAEFELGRVKDRQLSLGRKVRFGRAQLTDANAKQVPTMAPRHLFDFRPRF
jgi:hypothetical protein